MRYRLFLGSFLRTYTANNELNLRIYAEISVYIYRIVFIYMAKYIYQYPYWPSFSWQSERVSQILGELRYLQGKLVGQMKTVGFVTKAETNLNTLAIDVVKSSEIEGEKLDYEQVRSSIARRLGININPLVASSRHVDGVVEMMLDANQHAFQPLTHERLFSWHAALFPTGYSGVHKIELGTYRSGEMQIVSGAIGKERVHYEAVPANRVKQEMDAFVSWFQLNEEVDPVLKAAIAHFWFIIIHPFDDGNGRIARALSDMMLRRAEGTTERFYSMSNQILHERKQYYEVLQKVQHSERDITEWILWFLNCLKKSLEATQLLLENIFRKSEFWKIHEELEINERQRLMLNKLLDGFEGKLKTSKWAKITKCSPDTALRDIKDLIEKGILQQEIQGGRSTNYELVRF